MSTEPDGVAYALWREVESRRLAMGLDKAELAKRTGLGRTTIDRLKSGTRPPAVKTVHTLADHLHIDRREAEVLAALRRPDTTEAGPSEIDVREAIKASPAYTPQQREMLLSMVDTIEKANGGWQPRIVPNLDETPQTQAK